MSATERLAGLRDQLAHHPYEVRAGEFVRFHADENDDVIAGIVRAVLVEGEAGTNHFRRSLGADEVDSLRLFAMRRTLLAHRQLSPGSIFEAMDAFALLPTLTDVPWDSWLQAALFVARSLGGDLAMIGRRFTELAGSKASDRCRVAIDAMDRVESLSQCHIVEVKTTHGVGFVETLVFRDTPAGGFYGAPTLGFNQIEYHPTTNLAQLAASLADALDATARVVTSPIGQDQLAATSFSLTASGSYLPVAGCLSFIVDSMSKGETFTVFVAELPDDTDVEALARAAVETNDQAASHDGRRLVMFSPQPRFDESGDVEIDFHDLEELARTALGNPATW